MTYDSLQYRETHSTYPGEYIPVPITLEELLLEFEQPHERKTRLLVNIVDMPDFFMIEVAAPGLISSDFCVKINGNILSISLKQKNIEHGKNLYRQLEFNDCYLKREIELPGNIDPDFISASYTNGILSANVPKGIEPPRHRVDRIMVY